MAELCGPIATNDSRFEPLGELERDRYARLGDGLRGAAAAGSVTLARAARGEEDVAGQSVLKLLGSDWPATSPREARAGHGPGPPERSPSPSRRSDHALADRSS